MKVTPTTLKSSVTFKTKDTKDVSKMTKWWEAKSKTELNKQLLSSVAFLKENQNFRQKQASLYARLYGNMSLYNFVGSSPAKMTLDGAQLPVDRPTFNLIQSSIDTLVSRISQSRPAPVFLTDNSDYKERNLAKKLNNFILGEFYQTKAYDKATLALKDALVEGTGCLHVYETDDHKVGVERVLLTELFIDPNEGIYGEPRRLYRVKLVDREVLAAAMPAKKGVVEEAQVSYVDNSIEASKSNADLVVVVEAWSLPSGKDTSDGKHVLACSSGILLEEEYTKDKFPFVFLHYSKRLLGFWSQGVAEQLMGTQVEINSLLFTISKAIKLVGVPRIFQEKGSKVNTAAHNNEIGTIIEYSGTMPTYQVAQCVPQELYAQLQRLIDYGYQQCGVSQLQAAAQKPQGLDSGEAIRSYENIASDRFALLSKNYDTVFIDLAYLIIDLAKDICEREGKYSTIYPNKNGVKEIDLPKASILDDPFVIQCFNMSSLPRDPAGRFQKVTEMIQSGMISLREGRRLLDFPDTQQMDILDNAAEERIFQYLDLMIEEGEYNPPDPFMDIDLAIKYTVSYYNLYTAAKLEEEKAELLRNFYAQCVAMKQASMPPPMAPQPGAGNPPQATPQPLPQSPLIPNGNPGMPGAA